MRVQRLSLLLLALCLCAYFDSASAIRYFTDLTVTSSEPLFDREVLYTAADAPGFGHNESHITVDIEYVVTKLTNPNGTAPSGLSVVIYYYERASDVSISKVSEGTIFVDFCCNPNLQNTYPELPCSIPGPIAYNDTDIWVYNVPVDTIFRETVKPTKSGVYHVLAIPCYGSGIDSVLMQAYVIAQNPYGFLPADLYPLYPFYGSLAAAYLIVGIIWSYFSYQHMDHLLTLQHFITIVIFLNMLVSATWYFNYLTWNMHGSMVTMGYVGGIGMSTLKRTMCRLLLLLAAMGFSVTKANLGATQYRVMVLAVVYFICSAIQESLEMARMQKSSSGMNQAASGAEGVFTIPSSILELVFWWWTFLSLLGTLAQVRMRGQVAKETLYRKFLYCLVIAAVASLTVMLVELLAIDGNDSYWPVLWIFDAGFWDTLNFCVLVYLAWLWLPSADNAAYAFGELHDEELSIVPSMIAADQVIQRREPRSTAAPGKESALHAGSPLEKDELIEALTNFALDDEERQALENPKNAKIE